MTEIVLSRDDREWMWHSVRLAQARLDKLPANAHPGLKPRLRYEVRVREFVMAHLYRELHGNAAVWRRYMIAHARLQQERYGKRIDHDAFQAACRALRQKRDQADARVVGVAWLKISNSEVQVTQ